MPAREPSLRLPASCDSFYVFTEIFVSIFWGVTMLGTGPQEIVSPVYRLVYA